MRVSFFFHFVQLGSVEEQDLRSLQNSPTNSPNLNGIEVTICSGSDENCVRGLLGYLNQEMRDVVKSVSFKPLPYNISEINDISLEGIKVMVLCHSINNRGFLITDETGALYDKLLERACEALGNNSSKLCLQNNELHFVNYETILGSLRRLFTFYHITFTDGYYSLKIIYICNLWSAITLYYDAAVGNNISIYVYAMHRPKRWIWIWI